MQQGGMIHTKGIKITMKLLKGPNDLVFKDIYTQKSDYHYNTVSSDRVYRPKCLPNSTLKCKDL